MIEKLGDELTRGVFMAKTDPKGVIYISLFLN